jgi:hypothetical protein
MTYQIRYFFDPGSGVCLWAGNAAARERFGYPIDHRTVDISENARRQLDYLIAWFDTSLDWDSPPATRWPEEEWQRFRQAAHAGLEMLRSQLRPPEWEVLDEIRI